MTPAMLHELLEFVFGMTIFVGSTLFMWAIIRRST